MVARALPPGPAPAGPAPRGGLGPIQVIPPGLMGLLQLKQTGELPGDLGRVVAGVIELRDWYLTARRVDENTLFGGSLQRLLTAGSIGFGALQVGAVNAIVPNGQIWFVEEFCIQGPTNAAADTLSFSCGISTAQGSDQVVGPPYIDTVTARQRFPICKADRGFWAFPGDQFDFVIHDYVSAGGITVRGFLRATPCPI